LVIITVCNIGVMNSAQETCCYKVRNVVTSLKLCDEDGDCDDLENVRCTEFVYLNIKNMKISDFTISHT
jgi:hypothetical protein